VRLAIVVDLDDRRRLTLPARYLEAGNVTHAYALTGHKMQGLTIEQAFVLADDRRALKEWGYVALTRAREKTRLYTIKSELEPDAPPQRPEPAGPLDRLADALNRPAAETLALDSTARSARDRLAPRMRALTERQRRLEKERAQTARQLHQTKRQLADLGVLGRARQGRRLREQITERREQLAAVENELARLELERREFGARFRELQRVERPRRGRELARQRSRERGLELGL
jgi:hypothetical protein